MFREKPWFTEGDKQTWNRRLKEEGVEDYNTQKTKVEDRLDDPEETSTDHNLPEGLFDISELADSPELREAIYYAYSQAIARRGRTPLGEDRFNYHFFEGGSSDRSLAFGDKKRGFLLGARNRELGIFTPTHFAPFTLRGGYELFQDLGESTEIPAILAITPDLEETLRKMPSWHSLGLPSTLSASFHTGENMEKKLMYNDYFSTPNGQALARRAIDYFMSQHNIPEENPAASPDEGG